MARVRVVEIEGSDAVVVEAVRSLVSGAPAPVSVEPVAAGGIEAPVERAPSARGQARRPVLRRQTQAEACVTDGTTVARICEVLLKGAKTSGDVIKALPGVTASNIYSTLHAMKKAGKVRTVENPHGVGKLYELVK